MRWSKKLRTTRSAKRKMLIVINFRTLMPSFSGPPSPGSPRGYRRGSPGDGSEGGPLLRGAEDADRVARLQHQVCPGVGDHLLSPHYGQNRRPGLAPHAEVPYGATQKGAILALTCLGDLSLGKSYPIYFDGL